ncbi:hypothetical protein BGZ57DRAFT_1019545 [Hyaloscypha finlandica]|nr:hypothetical protein BGZ57DRAFT_1019545 [Hyaloscypha finlandica]
MATDCPSARERLAQAHLIFDPSGPVLICQKCQYALAPSGTQVTSHLRIKHQTPLHLRGGLTKYVQSLGLPDPATISLRGDGAPAHLHLQVYKGHACRQCDYRTTSLDLITRHVGHKHSKTSSTFDTLYDNVSLQAWTQGASRKYWTVRQHGSLMRCPVNPDVQAHLQSVHNRERNRLELDKRAASYSMDTGIQTLAGTRLWAERTRWAITYEGARRDILQGLAKVPSPRSFIAGHIIGEGSYVTDPELVSSGQDEQKIASLIAAVDRMLDRCEETVRHTSHVLLRWLRSTGLETCYPKPFTLVGLETSKKQYRRYWKRFVTFCFRAYRMHPDRRWQLTGVRFSKKQLIQLQAVWEHDAWSGVDLTQGMCSRPWDRRKDVGNGKEDNNPEDMDNTSECSADNSVGDEDKGGEEGGDQSDREDEYEDDEEEEEEEEREEGEEEVEEGQVEGEEYDLADGCSTEDVLLELFVDGQPSSSLLVYFSGILGFSMDARSFLPAKRYTPCLSGLIYIQRLLFLEYALPYRAYHYLGIPRRSHLQQHQKLNFVRKRYMIAGSPTPLEEFQNLRDFGRKVARTDTPSFFLRWSDDGQTLFYGDDFSLTMDGFRSLAKHFLLKAEELCEGLMFDLKPAIDLAKVKDDMTNVQSGFSFVQHSKNGLTNAYLELSRRACNACGRGLFERGGWDWKAISLYWKSGETFLEMLMCLLYSLGGQVPRGPELFSIECQNGPLTERGIYVYNGYMVYIIRHHKAKRSTNREFNVVRFLPVQVGHILYKYLVYIRPFINMLHDEYFHASDFAAPSPRQRLLFQSKHMGQPVSSRLFRQITIGIAEKHVLEVHQPFNRYDDRSDRADRNVVFSWQSGHRPIQRARSYGLDGAFPSQLQPALLRIYEWASVRWHEFLHQPSRVMPQSQLVEAGLKSEHAMSLTSRQDPALPIPTSPN